MPSYGTIDHEYGHKLATTDPADDGPVWMVNLMKYKEVADYGDGADSGRSGRDADDEYTRPVRSRRSVPRSSMSPRSTPRSATEHSGTACDREVPDSPLVHRDAATLGFPGQARPQGSRHGDDLRDRLSADGHRHERAGEGKQLLGRRRASSRRRRWRPARPPRHQVERGRRSGWRATTMRPSTSHRNTARIAGWFEAEGTIVGDGRT